MSQYFWLDEEACLSTPGWMRGVCLSTSGCMRGHVSVLWDASWWVPNLSYLKGEFCELWELPFP